MIGPVLGGLPRLRYTSDKVNVVFDGNSLVRGDGSTNGQNLVTQVSALAPLNGQLVVPNLGIDGQTIAQMRSGSSDVEASWVPGKTNVLVVWEGTNSINYGASSDDGTGAFNDMAAYCADRLALHPWKLVMMTTLPRYNLGATQAQVDTFNAKLVKYSSLLLANYKSIGAVAIVDVRQAGSPWIFPDYTLSTFESATALPYWANEGAGKHIHLNNAGYGVVARMVADVLKRLTAR
jgi:lysophospholipase L1-like esterase